MTVVSDSLAVCDQALPVVPIATANKAAGIHIWVIFIRHTHLYFAWETLHFVTGFVLACCRPSFEYKHELRGVHEDLIRNPF